MKQSFAQPNQSIAVHVGPMATLLGVLFAIMATSGSALAQYRSGAPVGVTRPSAYECSGVEGVALSNCRALNAAATTRAIEKAAEKKGASIGASHDCADMTGAALSTCRDLNGQVDAQRATMR